MTYYLDMSSYKYIQEFVRPNTFNIGWLSRDHPFERGESPHVFKQRLLEFCLSPVCKTRGWHLCEFCNGEDAKLISIEGCVNTPLYLGSAEIRVVGGNKVFACPNLIYHYVTVHGYLPPKEFIEAVINSPLPSSEEYKKRFWDL